MIIQQQKPDFSSTFAAQFEIIGLRCSVDGREIDRIQKELFEILSIY